MGTSDFVNINQFGLILSITEIDAASFAQRCQIFQLDSHAPKIELHSLSTPWSFLTLDFI